MARVLFVEDNQSLAAGMARLARLLKHSTVCASDAQQARALLTPDTDITVVVSDLGLPGHENGIDLLRWVKEFHPRILRILTTGSSYLPPDGDDVPWQAFLAKPFGNTELDNALRIAHR